MNKEEFDFLKLDEEFETTAMPVEEIEEQLRLRREVRENSFIEEGTETIEEQNIPYQRIVEPMGEETKLLDASLVMEELKRREMAQSMFQEFSLTGYEEDSDDVVDEIYEDEDEYIDYLSAREGSFGEEADEYEYEEVDDISFLRVMRSKRYGRNVFARLGYYLIHMSWFDRIVILTGIIVIGFAVATLNIFATNRNTKDEIAAFAQIGSDLEDITIIGESGILAAVQAANAQIEIPEEITEEEETVPEETTQNEHIRVGMKLSSIQKDLKIKFINRDTDKLLASVPFTVQMKGPDGNTTTKTDEDKDGVIYLSGIASGKYTVSMQPLEGFDQYEFPADSSTITVKDAIEYKKVDVADEVKTEAQVNVAVEDTKKQETVVESVLTDTVEWVESTKKENTASYTEVKKSDITDPATLARAFSNGLFLASKSTGSKTERVETASGNETLVEEKTIETALEIPDAVTVKKGESTTITVSRTNIDDISLSVSDSSIASVSRNGDSLSVSGVAAGETTLTVSGGELSVTCKITVSKDPVTLTLDAKELTIKVDGAVTLKANVSGASNSKVKWSSSDNGIATVNGNGEVKGLKKGTVTITATSEEDSSATATCKINVSDKLTVALDQKSIGVAKGKTVQLKATVSNFGSDSGVKWTTADSSIATVSDSGVVTGVKSGKTTITAKCKEDEKITASCEVTVTDGLSVSVDPTSMSVKVGKTGELKVKVSGYSKSDKVTYKSSDEAIAKVNEKGVVTGVKKGKATITIFCEENKDIKTTCEVTVKNGAEDDTSSKLKDKNGNQLYYKDKDGNYHEATYADYYKYDVFYLKNTTFLYTGWQTIDNTLYFFDKNGNKVTGEQIIQGAKYKFADNGALITGSGTLGIDVSKYNGTIDWAAVKNSGISYVIIRCGYRGSTTGALIEDPKFKTNIKGAQAAGLKVGIYFFTQAINEVEAVEEASMVLSLIKPYAISYPVYLDVESSGGRADGISKDMRTAVCNAFCATIANSGYTAGVYANKTWFTEKINTPALGKSKIWLAQYAAAPTYSGSYHMWQYSSKGSVSGISGKVDMNLSYLGY